ncbi:alpha/beta fold hydrolase [Bacillus sp. FJAT-45037]|uniref:alpha/beta fold hydrolase n=1 Tax=Bacillus sp. FJAT-45037 TaxID=2011007 RepID=UPI000C23732E|nr:alpha/beta hydrolase [Bacillus sp. FJAT-45037]
MAYTNYKGMKIYYEVRGKGVPLVFLHPPAMSHLTFRYQSELQQIGQLIFIDLPGNGHSISATKKALTIEEEADCVHAVLKKLRRKRAILIGYSNGGSVAQEVALKYPTIINGLILIGGFPEVSSVLLEQEFKLGIWAARKGWLPLISKVLAVAHFKNNVHQTEMKHLIEKVDPNWLADTYQYGYHYHATNRLNQLTIPLLLLYGQRDLFMHPYMYDFAKKVEDLEIVFVEGVAHQVPTKRYEECNHAVKEWLQRKELLFS